jgi:hypothetical protein
MDTTMLVAVVGVVAAVLLVAVVATMLAKARRTRRLRSRFGSEYARAVNGHSRRDVEDELLARQRRVEGYALRALDDDELRQFRERWRAIRAEFVDRPGEAVAHADALVAEVMKARGYESATPLERVEDLSVGHGDEAEEYRLARASAIRNANGADSTEELRQAMIHFERVFAAMLHADPVH